MGPTELIQTLEKDMITSDCYAGFIFFSMLSKRLQHVVKYYSLSKSSVFCTLAAHEAEL